MAVCMECGQSWDGCGDRDTHGPLPVHSSDGKEGGLDPYPHPHPKIHIPVPNSRQPKNATFESGFPL